MQNNFNERTIRCTFCDKTSEQVRWLFTSERANICYDYVIFIMMLTTRKQQKLRSSLTVATSEARLRKWQALSRG